MKVRAAIFDIYTTILNVGPPPPNGEALWAALFREMLGKPPTITRTEFSVHTAQVIARQHAAARARGIRWPEIQWPSIVLETIPDLARLSASELEEFLLRQMQIGRTLRLADGAAKCLLELHKRGILLGIASNSQAYTIREIEAALQGTDLTLSSFDRTVCFWSFENGFSKPDPHVFQILTSRLEARGISPEQTLMVGDRLDNDIQPAQAQGWRTWHLVSAKQNQSSGNWHDLLAWLELNG